MQPAVTGTDERLDKLIELQERTLEILERAEAALSELNTHKRAERIEAAERMPMSAAKKPKL